MGAEPKLLNAADIQTAMENDRNIHYTVLSLMDTLHGTGMRNFGHLSPITDLKILVPEYFKKMLSTALSSLYNHPDPSSGIMLYRGVLVLEGYENALIMFHKDAPLMLDNKLYTKVELSGKIVVNG